MYKNTFKQCVFLIQNKHWNVLTVIFRYKQALLIEQKMAYVR